MITSEVNLQPFCDDCNEFEPNAFTHKYYANNEVVCYRVNIRCKNEKHCCYLYEHLKKENKNE